MARSRSSTLAVRRRGAALTFNDIHNLSSNLLFTQGTFGGGAAALDVTVVGTTLSSSRSTVYTREILKKKPNGSRRLG